MVSGMKTYTFRISARVTLNSPSSSQSTSYERNHSPANHLERGLRRVQRPDGDANSVPALRDAGLTERLEIAHRGRKVDPAAPVQKKDEPPRRQSDRESG